MPTHPDAIGYLNDLANEINEPWFKMVCDLAAVSGVSELEQPTLDILFALYKKNATYIGVKPMVAAVAPLVPAVPADSLEQISGFANFKLLGNTLNVRFKKRVNLIFGANGSGKSSLCESLKVLATPGRPNRPLENVHASGAATPTFSYKFKSDVGPQTWMPSLGYGSRRATVKYFDTAIAIQNVTDPVEPGRVIELTPFRLHVFELTKVLTTKFREALQQAQRDNSAKLDQALQSIRTDFEKFKNYPLAVITDRTVFQLPNQIQLGKDFKDNKLLGEKQTIAAALEKAASEQGLKLLYAEYREMESFLNSLNTLLTSAAELWTLDPANKANSLSEKIISQEVLAKALIPEGSNLDTLMGLLRSVSPLCPMDEAGGHSCPLCKRELGITEVELFKQYHGLIAGELEKDIVVLKGEMARVKELSTIIGKVDHKSWDKLHTIPEDVLAAARTEIELVIASCDITKEPLIEARDALESLKTLAIPLANQMESKKIAIEAAERGRDKLLEQLMTLRSEIEPLEYAQAVANRAEMLKEAQQTCTEAQFWSTALPSFTQVLKRITEKLKEAHEDLVVGDFEKRLNAEYRVLAEKDMAAFGVKLARKGAYAAVTVLPQIGGRDIERVLSEGEQRLHALALFFAELESCPQPILVFDDPTSSFDYNYIGNYCTRLRDFTIKHSTRQVIVMTHNWEFFAQLQTTMKQAGLAPHLSVYVLENCTVVDEYSEKVDDLKNGIAAILVASGELIKEKKEVLAGKMRRLIEAVVNTHVFNNQRHQYKQKSQMTTAFDEFTKIVPLLPIEATILRDLYAKLSITEHDDPRTAYVNTDKAMFQTRYNQILEIETAIKDRISR